MAVMNVAQGCAAVHGSVSTPVLDTHTAGDPANTGATCKKAVRTMVTAKSFAMIRIMSRPCDVAPMPTLHHDATGAKDRQRPDSFVRRRVRREVAGIGHRPPGRR